MCQSRAHLNKTGRRLGLAAALLLAVLAGSSPVPVVAAGGASLIISEVHPGGSGNSTYGADWFEVTNTGTTSVDITGWKVDDSSNSFAAALALRGVTTIPAGASVIFLEANASGSNDATKIQQFRAAWFGSNPPADLIVGAYGGSGIGLSTDGDAVNLFNAAGTWVTGVTFGAVPGNGATLDNTIAAPAVANTSTVGVNGAFAAVTGGEVGSPGTRVAPVLSTIDLSRYYRVGRFELPQTAPSAGNDNTLAREASAVTYNWDTDTLFITGDTGRAITQVTKDGRLIDSMALPSGGSSQGTEFFDPEGLTYVGHGQFVMTEERDRRAVLFTYVPNTTLQRSDAKTVGLGTFVDNIGLEGITYDPFSRVFTQSPLSAGFVVVKEISPMGIFQTDIDFDAGTASNGSPTTENSIDLFDPALTGLADFGDVFSLSNILPPASVQYGHLLVLSQESGKIVNISRTGQIANSLAIRPDPDSILSVADQQHEGLTMDRHGVLYVVNENGGGSIEHPQLWVYVPAFFPNQAPTGLQLTQRTESIAEHTPIPARRKVATIVIDDDPLGENLLTVTGPDAAFFEVDISGLYLKANTNLDFETKSSYTVMVAVDDPTSGTTPDATAIFTLAVTDVEEGGQVQSLIISEVAPWASGDSPGGADWFEVTNIGTASIDISGWRMDDDSESFGPSVALNGITTIAPGESVIFIETGNLAAAKAAFLNTWFGANAPAGLQVGSYSGGGVGLSTGGDAVVLFDGAGAVQARATFGASSNGVFATFENTVYASDAHLAGTSAVGLRGAFAAVNDTKEIGSPGVRGRLAVTEVAPWSSGNSPVAADWFEVTNTGGQPVYIGGWKVDDDSESPVDAVPLAGIDVIAPGESVIFMETSAASFPAAKARFLQTWFGANPPATLQIGSYSGSGVGLGTGGDVVVLYNAAGVRQARVAFGASSTGPFRSFDNSFGLDPVTVAQLSVAGVNGAFAAAADANEIGSPGRVASLVISEVAPWSNDSSVGADWFEVTNTGAQAIDITGWKMDDSSFNLEFAVALTGIRAIAPGESVVFLETGSPAAARELFLATWFGVQRPSGLQVGSYSGGGVGLSSGGDGVALFDASGAEHARVTFGGGSAANGLRSFDNGVGLNATTLTTLSAPGVRGAFTAAGDATQIGSPGVVKTLPTLTFGGLALNRVTREFAQPVTVRNNGAEPIVGPVYLALDGLSNATLVNKIGNTVARAPYGSPYVSVLATGATLAPGASLSITLQFTPPASGQIGYVARLLMLAPNTAP